jgi:hypothetical protein
LSGKPAQTCLKPVKSLSRTSINSLNQIFPDLGIPQNPHLELLDRRASDLPEGMSVLPFGWSAAYSKQTQFPALIHLPV